MATKEKSKIEILLESLKSIDADNLIIASYRDITEIKKRIAELLSLIEREEELRGY